MNALIRKKLNILIHLAAADGEVSEEERAYILDIAFRNGMHPGELKVLMRYPESIGSLGALSMDKVQEYLQGVIELMIVDGKVLQSEILFCVDVAIKLGYTKSTIDNLIDEVKTQELKSLTSDVIQKMISTLPHPNKI